MCIRDRYETLEGFGQDITQVEDFADLPEPARRYVLRLEELLGLPITMVGVGPSRQQMLRRPR